MVHVSLSLIVDMTTLSFSVYLVSVYLVHVSLLL